MKDRNVKLMEGLMERIKESEYGQYTQYICMKIGQWNLLKLF
jgi:hypothetical protein